MNKKKNMELVSETRLMDAFDLKMLIISQKQFKL